MTDFGNFGNFDKELKSGVKANDRLIKILFQGW